MTIPAAIIGEAVLSFLGLGVQPPTPSWGVDARGARRRTSLRRRGSRCTRGSRSSSLARRSTCSATACATCSTRGRRAMTRAAARGRRTSRSASRPTTGRCRRSTASRSRSRRGEVLGIVGESGLRQERDDACRSLRLLPETASGDRAARVFEGDDLLALRRARDLRRVRGREISFVFQEPMTSLNPVVHGRHADRRGAAPAPRALAARGARARGRAARPRPHPRRRSAASTSTRTSSPAGCGSA